MNEIEELSMNAWPALQTEFYDGWVLRYANGYTKRANSVNPIYNSSIPLLVLCQVQEATSYIKLSYKSTYRTPSIPQDGMVAWLDMGKVDGSHGSVEVRGYRRVLMACDLCDKEINVRKGYHEKTINSSLLWYGYNDTCWCFFIGGAIGKTDFFAYFGGFLGFVFPYATMLEKIYKEVVLKNQN